MQIIVDGSCDFYPEFFEKVEVVPLFVYFGEKEYLSTDISMDEFYEMMEKSLPRTAQPTPKMFMEKIRPPSTVFSISSKLSGTYNAAKMAASAFNDVQVIDTLQASAGIALYVKNWLEGVERRIDVFGMPETLDLLIKNGRIGKVKGFIGKVLGILPLIELRDGELHPLRKARSQMEVVEELYRRGPETDEVIIVHTRPRMLDEIVDKVSESYSAKVVEAGPVIASHLGKGAVFLAYRWLE